MSLLDELEKKTINHPVHNFDFIDKSNYLKALSYAFLEKYIKNYNKDDNNE